jgi:hypothetical protein
VRKTLLFCLVFVVIFVVSVLNEKENHAETIPIGGGGESIRFDTVATPPNHTMFAEFQTPNSIVF